MNYTGKLHRRKKADSFKCRHSSQLVDFAALILVGSASFELATPAV